MKFSRRKLAALILVAATPGSMMFSCSGTVGREFRDAAISGATNFVNQATFDILDFFFPNTTATQ